MHSNYWLSILKERDSTKLTETESSRKDWRSPELLLMIKILLPEQMLQMRKENSSNPNKRRIGRKKLSKREKDC